MNTKKINELTPMETVSDAANVLVEENGEAKRVPAGKMVAGSLPEHLQFGETVVGGDTLTWDGNTEGLVSVIDQFYKVSDATPTVAQIPGTTTIKTAAFGADQTFLVTAEEATPDIVLLNVDLFGNIAPLAVVIMKDNTIMDEENGVVFPEAGFYVVDTGGAEITYTIPGYTGFLTKTVKPLDEKYLPGDLIPAYTAADEGKVLKIVNGVPTWVTP